MYSIDFMINLLMKKKCNKLLIKRNSLSDLKFRKVGAIFFNNFILINKIFEIEFLAKT